MTTVAGVPPFHPGRTGGRTIDSHVILPCEALFETYHGTAFNQLFDYLICLEQEPRGERQAERLGGLEINDQLELYRLFHREVDGLSALQYLVHEGSSTAIYLGEVRPIRHETSRFHPILESVDRRQFITDCEFREQGPVSREKNAVHLDKRLFPVSCLEGSFEVLRIAYIDAYQLHSERPRACLRSFLLSRVRWMSRIPEEDEARQLRHEILEQLHAFPQEIDRHQAHACNVSAGLDQRAHLNKKVRFRSGRRLLLLHPPYLNGFSGHFYSTVRADM